MKKKPQFRLNPDFAEVFFNNRGNTLRDLIGGKFAARTVTEGFAQPKFEPENAKRAARETLSLTDQGFSIERADLHSRASAAVLVTWIRLLK